jgi:hypothetical protein
VVKTPTEFPKLWHVVRAMKPLAVLGVALYDAVRAMQFSHEGELQLAIYYLLWGVAMLVLYIASVMTTRRGTRVVQVPSVQNGVCSRRIC